MGSFSLELVGLSPPACHLLFLLSEDVLATCLPHCFRQPLPPLPKASPVPPFHGLHIWCCNDLFTALSPNTLVPSLFATRERFCGRQIFHGLGWGLWGTGGGAQVIMQGHPQAGGGRLGAPAPTDPEVHEGQALVSLISISSICSPSTTKVNVCWLN